MFRTVSIAIALTSALAISAGVAFAADAPSAAGTHIVLRPQAFHTIEAPPKRPSAGDTAITVYRVLDATGAKRLGRAQFVCVATDAGDRHQQCTGTITLPDGQLATQGTRVVPDSCHANPRSGAGTNMARHSQRCARVGNSTSAAGPRRQCRVSTNWATRSCRRVPRSARLVPAFLTV
jgi:hypothetical protein